MSVALFWELAGILALFCFSWGWFVAKLRRRTQLTKLDLREGYRFKSERFASEFPQPADVYICHRCGRDVTKHLHPPRGHGGRAIGPEQYACTCGERYLTGAVEWDHLPEHGRGIGETLFVGLFLSAFLSPLGIGIYFLLHRTIGALASSVAITTIPLTLMLLLLGRDVIPSIWRTRFKNDVAWK
jgi:DNA-directed RNA polymerase subunit RPC12/RpoP